LDNASGDSKFKVGANGAVTAGAITGSSLSAGSGTVNGGIITATTQLISDQDSDTAATGPLIDFRRTRTTDDNVVDNDYIGELRFRGYHSLGYREGAIIRAVVNGTPGEADMPTELIFATSADGSATPTTRLTLDAAGLATFAGDVTISGGDITLGTSAIFSGGDTTSLNLIDAIDATTETTLEGALDIDGEVSSTGMGTTVLDETGISLTSITVGSLLGVDSIDATGAVDMDYGSADITDHTFVTDSTGDAEIVLPNDSIGDAEIAFDEVTGADLTLTDAGAITASGLITANANLDVKNGAATSGVLTIYEDSTDGSNFASIQVPALAANTVYTLPADDGGSGEVLSTNGSGALDWVADAGGAETNSLETICTGIATTEIPIGTAANTVVYAALSGEASMANNGAVTLADSVSVSSWNLTTPTITTSLTTSTPTTLSAAELDRLDGLTSAIIDDDKIDTIAELDAIVVDANVLSEEEIDASSELLALMDDETGSASGSPLAVFNVNPTLTGATMAGAFTLGENGIILDPAISADGYYSGITEAGTAGATLAFGDLVYLNNDDSRWELADANLSDGYDKKLGICVLAAAGDASATTILLYGKVNAATAFPSLTIGAPAHISETAGDIVVAAPTTTDAATRIVGFGNAADELFFCHSPNYYTHT
jgi:hypothetical protein